MLVVVSFCTIVAGLLQVTIAIVVISLLFLSDVVSRWVKDVARQTSNDNKLKNDYVSQNVTRKMTHRFGLHYSIV